jgi:NAD(P)-dependent dehydrogenase (short-subunit alcohol dehydrogenase family)
VTTGLKFANNQVRGLGAVICRKFAEEGANVAINYFSNADAAQEVADSLQPYSVKTFIVQGVCI